MEERRWGGDPRSVPPRRGSFGMKSSRGACSPRPGRDHFSAASSPSVVVMYSTQAIRYSESWAARSWLAWSTDVVLQGRRSPHQIGRRYPVHRLHGRFRGDVAAGGRPGGGRGKGREAFHGDFRVEGVGLKETGRGTGRSTLGRSTSFARKAALGRISFENPGAPFGRCLHQPGRGPGPWRRITLPSPPPPPPPAGSPPPRCPGEREMESNPRPHPRRRPNSGVVAGCLPADPHLCGPAPARSSMEAIRNQPLHPTARSRRRVPPAVRNPG